MLLENASRIELALLRTGELLQAQGLTHRIVVIGGAVMNLLGYVSRTTTDVDILAFGSEDQLEGVLVPPPKPLPAELESAIRTVARDLGLNENWLNTGPALQWQQGLPPGLAERVHWRSFAGLDVGLVDRQDLIFFKLYAAADTSGPGSVHFQDLMALVPKPEELAAAQEWVRTQDSSPGFTEILDKVVDHARRLG